MQYTLVGHAENSPDRLVSTFKGASQLGDVTTGATLAGVVDEQELNLFSSFNRERGKETVVLLIN